MNRSRVNPDSWVLTPTFFLEERAQLQRKGCVGDSQEGVGAVQARDEWAGETLPPLERLVVRGWLTAEDAREVEDTLREMLGRLRAGTISEHCFAVVLRRLAQDKARAFWARQKEAP